MKEFISRLTWVECIAILAVLRGGYTGFRSGFFPELLRSAGYLVTVIVTFHFHGSLARTLTLNTFLNEGTASAVSLVLLLGSVFLVTKLLTMLVLRMLKVGEGGFLYRVAGAVFGAGRWIILLSLIFMMIDHLPLGPLKTDIHERSVAGPVISRVAPSLFDFLSALSPQLGVSGKEA